MFLEILRKKVKQKISNEPNKSQNQEPKTHNILFFYVNGLKTYYTVEKILFFK